jgi:hypothetical protein
MMLPLGVLKNAADAEDGTDKATMSAPMANPAISMRLPDIGRLVDREAPMRESTCQTPPCARISGRIDGSR